MACCEQKRFVSFYLYENGKPCNPEELRIPEKDISKHFTKKGQCYFYDCSYIVYDLEGNSVDCLDGSEDVTAFVLVPKNDDFIADDYKADFNETLNKNNQNSPPRQTCPPPARPPPKKDNGCSPKPKPKRGGC